VASLLVDLGMKVGDIRVELPNRHFCWNVHLIIYGSDHNFLEATERASLKRYMSVRIH
jgi:hypothetical protein